MKSYKLVEIFSSVQGEGGMSGVPMTFVRFTGCNLDCSWCDTPFNEANYSSCLEGLVNKITDFANKWVIFTGGEPTLQLDEDLIDELHMKDHMIAIETNGTQYEEYYTKIDYITVSPKTTVEMKRDNCSPAINETLGLNCNLGGVKVNEVRVPMDGKHEPPILAYQQKLRPDILYVSPVFAKDNKPIVEAVEQALSAVELYSLLMDIRLSIQAHKFLEIR